MGIRDNQLTEMAFVELRGQEPVRYLCGQLFHHTFCPGFPRGKATQYNSPGRVLLSAALLCILAGWTRASSVLWLNVIRVVVGMGSTVCEACQAPHTASSREAAAPQEERLGGAMVRGGHSGLCRAEGSAHCSSPVPPSLHWDETIVILIAILRRQNHPYPVRLI